MTSSTTHNRPAPSSISHHPVDDQRTVSDRLDDLETLLEQMLAHHTRMHALVQRKREAMRTGDTQAMSSLCRLEHETVQHVADLEKQRLSLAASLTQTLVPEANEPMRLRELAQHLPSPQQNKLLDIHSALRKKMELVKIESSVARRAAEALAKHMTGLIQTIGEVSTGVSTYGQQGAPPRSATTLRTISMQA